MTEFTLRRLPAAVATLVLSSFLIYSALYAAPGDPITTLAGGRQLTPAAVKDLRSEYDLDQPFFVRYFDWVGRAVSGDLGKSVVTQGQPVASLIATRALTTILLLVMSATLIVVVGVGLGAIAGLRVGIVRTVITVTTGIGLAIPTFVAATVLITIFAVQLGWFPVFGPGQGLTDRLWHMVLPAIALAMSSVAYVAQTARAAVEREAGREHVLTATARGFPRAWIARHHVLRNATIPIATVSGLTIGYLLVGAAIVEKAFALDGIGSLLVDAVEKRDFAVVQGICLLLVTAFVLINLLLDLTYRIADPRLRVDEHQ